MFFHRFLYVYQRVTLFFGLDYGGLVPLWWSTIFYDRGGTILGDHKGILIWGWHDMAHFRIAAYIMLNSFNSHVFFWLRWQRTIPWMSLYGSWIFHVPFSNYVLASKLATWIETNNPTNPTTVELLVSKQLGLDKFIVLISHIDVYVRTWTTHTIVW